MAVRERASLLIGDRHQRQIAERREQGRIVRKIEPPMHGGDDVAGTQQARQRQVQEVTMDVDHVELIRAAPQLLELQRGVNQGLLDGRVQAQGARHDGVQLRRSARSPRSRTV